MDPSSHHFCVNRQGGAIEYKFPSMGRLQIDHSTHSLDSLSETLPMSPSLTKVRLHCLLACASCALAAIQASALAIESALGSPSGVNEETCDLLEEWLTRRRRDGRHPARG